MSEEIHQKIPPHPLRPSSHHPSTPPLTPPPPPPLHLGPLCFIYPSSTVRWVAAGTSIREAAAAPQQNICRSRRHCLFFCLFRIISRLFYVENAGRPHEFVVSCIRCRLYDLLSDACLHGGYSSGACLAALTRGAGSCISLLLPCSPCSTATPLAGMTTAKRIILSGRLCFKPVPACSTRTVRSRVTEYRVQSMGVGACV